MASENAVRDRDNRDLVLPPNTFAYVLDSTKGKVSVYVGPHRNSLSNTDQLVIWDSSKGRFVLVNDVEKAIQVFSVAGEGQYLVLSNPVCDTKNLHPLKGTSSESVELEIGRKVNVPGPATFPLWPGQTSTPIEGHHLRHNQYLIVRVYDEGQAKKNWQSAVVKPQVTQPASNDGPASPAPVPTMVSATETSPTLTMGQLMLVKGTEVSFYIPPTGIEVVPDTEGKFVREAVTLELLEYCILLDENGEKHYTRGPAVVFPSPTEKFMTNEKGNRQFPAIELNEHSGLYIKVIANYTEGKTEYKVGQELFITGKEQAIYFPRPEHSVISYDGKNIHYAIAVPAGEGRYVLDRDKGTVDLICGPKMFLPDPRTQVIILRTLDPHTVDLFYPGNKEAQDINTRYRQMSAALAPGAPLASSESAKSLRAATLYASSMDFSDEIAGDSFKRKNTYTPPRSIVLDTKYEGAVAVNIWPGYAVLITKKTGERRVELGPKMVLLEYDETLMPLELSTGRPKTDSKRFRTAYLRVQNNQVGDIVTVETKDLVKVNVEISYRVNFEGTTAEDQQKWFDVEDYVKILTDHCRSRLRNEAKHHGIQEFYTNTIDLIRNTILGIPVEGKRTGLCFVENGMRVYDVEVLNVSIDDPTVAELLIGAQETALSGAIKLSAAQEEAERTEKLEELKRKAIDERQKTAIKEAEVVKAAVGRTLDQRLAEAGLELAVVQGKQKVTDLVLAGDQKAEEQRIELARKNSTQEIERIQAETAEYVKRIEAVNVDMVAALNTFGDKHFVEEVTKAVGPLALATGVTTGDILGRIFEGTPFENAIKAINERPFAAKVIPGRKD